MATGMEVMERNEAGVSIRHEFGGTAVMRQAETAMAAVQAQQQAMVQARFVIAQRQKRSWDDIRPRILNLCKNTAFAEEALYVKPIARTPDEWKEWSKQERLQNAPADWPRGFSIRFIEAALFEAGNFDCPTLVLWEDDDKRMTQVTVTDLQSNGSYSKTITTAKTVERRRLKQGQTPIGVRENSFGDMIYILPATDDEVLQKEAAAVSKAIRTLGEKLLPPHHKVEWRRQIEATIASKAIQDPEAAKKEILDAFFKLGVHPSEIATYIGHAVDGLTPSEYVELRGVYVAIAAGDASWADAMQAKRGELEPDEKVEETPQQKAIKARIEAQRKKTAPATQPASPSQAGPAEQNTAAQPPTQQPEEKPIITPEDVAKVDAEHRLKLIREAPKFSNWDDRPEGFKGRFFFEGDQLWELNRATGKYEKLDNPLAAATAEAPAQTAKPVFGQKPLTAKERKDRGSD